MQHSEFKPIDKLSKMLIYTFFAGIFVDVVNIILSFVLLIFFPNIGEGEEIIMGELIVGLFSLVFLLFYILITVGLIVLFLVWIHRAYKNLYAFNVQGLEASPGWAIGWWFVPIANLFKPLQIVNEIYHASNPDNINSDFNYSDNSSPTLHIGWWVTWIIYGVLGNISMRVSAASDSITSTEVVFTVITSVFSIIAAILVIQIIKHISERQTESVKKLQSEEPPLPPNFFNQ